MSEPVCPGCQQPARALMGDRQAFCGNDECHVLMWDPTKSLEELAKDVNLVDPPNWES